jgi:N-dimethylarginine dimethylaminohydrolase
MTSILHLKSGISYIGENTLVVMEEMAENPQFRGFESDPGWLGRKLRGQLRARERPRAGGRRLSPAY